MVTRVDLLANQLLQKGGTANSALVNQTKQNTILNSTQLVIGKSFQAEVIATLKDGSSIVKVADVAARMQLPPSSQPGTHLQLTLISTSPRATFLLNSSDTPSAKPLTISAEIHLESPVVNPDPRLTTSLAESAPATLSTTGKLLDQLIQASRQRPAVTLNNTPLLPTPHIDTTVIAKALQNGLTSSGVFYESHLLQWSEAKRATAELLKEPQAKFEHDMPINTLTNEAMGIIQQQLQTLEQQRVAWHGQLWPGQPLEWEITREHPKHQREQSESSWQSAVRFELPQLGTITAQLHLTGTHLQLVVNTPNAQTTNVLQNHTIELVSALENTGTQLDALTIKTSQ